MVLKVLHVYVVLDCCSIPTQQQQPCLPSLPTFPRKVEERRKERKKLRIIIIEQTTEKRKDHGEEPTISLFFPLAALRKTVESFPLFELTAQSHARQVQTDPMHRGEKRVKLA